MKKVIDMLSSDLIAAYPDFRNEIRILCYF